jgi:hypothetical protein
LLGQTRTSASPGHMTNGRTGRRSAWLASARERWRSELLVPVRTRRGCTVAWLHRDTRGCTVILLAAPTRDTPGCTVIRLAAPRQTPVGLPLLRILCSHLQEPPFCLEGRGHQGLGWVFGEQGLEARTAGRAVVAAEDEACDIYIYDEACDDSDTVDQKPDQTTTIWTRSSVERLINKSVGLGHIFTCRSDPATEARLLAERSAVPRRLLGATWPA